MKSPTMSGPDEEEPVTVALLGNPNTGKSTLFSALCGVRQRIGNYPGVTVEKKIGNLDIDGQSFALIDLPGTYSLAPRSPDEMVAVDVLLGRGEATAPPAVIVCIVDASNLERNLYLVSQTLELGRPVVVALNKTDMATAGGVVLNLDLLRERLGVPVVPLQAHRRIGVEELKRELQKAVGGQSPLIRVPFPEVFQQQVTSLEREANRGRPTPLPRYLVARLLLDVGGYLEQAQPPLVDASLLPSVQAARQRLAQAGHPAPAVETLARYEWVAGVLEGAVSRPDKPPLTFSDRLDAVLTHKLWGTLVFAVVMALVFQSIFAWAAPLMNWLDHAMAALRDRLAATLPAGMLRSLIVDGVIAGVGGVLVFLPQILILFGFLAVLEECGYMARAAYLMDKLMSRIGFSGRSFIPLLCSFACAVPGVMAARAIENRRDRLVTILIAPLMSCSARLQVYSMLIAAFIPDRRYLGGWVRLQGITLLALYLIGVGVAVGVALVLRRTLLRGPTPSFLMELPGYKLPSGRSVAARMGESAWSFLRQAGTLIVAVAVVVWAAAYFPHDPQVEQVIRSRYAASLRQLDARISPAPGQVSWDPQPALQQQTLGAEKEAREQRINNEVAAAYMEQSYLGRAGKLITPLVRPLGWDWRIGCAVIASFPAREVVISTLGVIYQLGGDLDAASPSLRQTLREATWPGSSRRVFNVPVALSMMVFFALCAQCAATLAVIRRETRSWRWPVFTFAYMTTLAYLGALITYQVGMLIGG